MNEDDGLPEDAMTHIRTLIEEEHAYLSWLGTSVDEIESGRIVLSIPFDEKLTNFDGMTIHGGVAATLADTAGGIAQRTCLENPYAGGTTTINLNVNYLRPATGDLTATAEVVRSGSTIGVSELWVESTVDGETDLVAVGQGAFRLFRD